MYYVNAKSILNRENNLNIYRGCTHGCIYCDSRSKCYQIQGRFEDIEVKINAVSLLEEALKKKRKKIIVGTGSMCDPYLPLEKDLKLTRGMLECIEQYQHGVYILTKSNLVLRDLDVLTKINQHHKAIVAMTITTYDEALCKKIEPNVCTTKERFETLRKCKAAGLEVGIWLTPILPFINDTKENIFAILEEAIQIGVRFIITFQCFGVTLREGNREYFYQALDKHFPTLKERYIRTYHQSYGLMSMNSKTLYPEFIAKCKEHQILTTLEEVYQYYQAESGNSKK